jgi:hypothetical protein
MGTFTTGCTGSTLANLQQTRVLLLRFRVSSLQHFAYFSTRLGAGNGILAVDHKEKNSLSPGFFASAPPASALFFKSRIGKGFCYIRIRQGQYHFRELLKSCFHFYTVLFRKLCQGNFKMPFTDIAKRAHHIAPNLYFHFSLCFFFNGELVFLFHRFWLLSFPHRTDEQQSMSKEKRRLLRAFYLAWFSFLK